MRAREADAAMMRLCEFVKTQRSALPAAKVEKVLSTLTAMNLRPYWNYCREHMLDIGLQF